VEPNGVVEFRHPMQRHPPDPCAEALHGYRADLLRLRLRVPGKPRFARADRPRDRAREIAEALAARPFIAELATCGLA